MIQKKYKQLEKIFSDLFYCYKSALPLESGSEIQRYIQSAELEIAVEGFCLEVLEQKVSFSSDDK